MMVRTQIQLTQEQADALRTIAAAQGISMAELIRKGVDYILAKQPIISIEERRRRAIAAAGSFRSDVTDASTNHDYYLAEAYANGLH
jgi:Ribbon-helix-helix domain